MYLMILYIYLNITDYIKLNSKVYLRVYLQQIPMCLRGCQIGTKNSFIADKNRDLGAEVYQFRGTSMPALNTGLWWEVAKLVNTTILLQTNRAVCSKHYKFEQNFCNSVINIKTQIGMQN